MLRSLCVYARGPEKQIKMLFQALGDRIKAAGAWHFKVPMVSGAQTDVLDLIVGPAMFGDKVGASAYWHAIQLADAGAVIDGAGGNDLAEFKRLPFQVERSDQYGHGILTVTPAQK
jgi:hypothetical protein